MQLHDSLERAHRFLGRSPEHLGISEHPQGNGEGGVEGEHLTRGLCRFRVPSGVEERVGEGRARRLRERIQVRRLSQGGNRLLCATLIQQHETHGMVQKAVGRLAGERGPIAPLRIRKAELLFEG